MITIRGPQSVTLPSILGGDDTVYALVLVAISRGLYVKELGNGESQIENIKDLELVTPEKVQLLLSKGCEITGYPIYFDVADIEAEVPENFPNRTYTEESEDSEPVVKVHTWKTWYNGMPGHDPIPHENGFYCSSANTWNKGAPLPASFWGSLTTKTVGEVHGNSTPDEPNE